MLDIQLIRTEPQKVKESLAKRGYEADFEAFLEKDKERRQIISSGEQLKARRNRVSGQIPVMKKNGEDVTEVLKEMKEVSDAIKTSDSRLEALEAEQQAFLVSLPNMPADDVAAGGKENNEVIEVFGEKPAFDFEPQHHVDLAERLRLIDYVRGAKMSGSGYWLYSGWGARLEWALLNYFITEHTKDGYEMLLVPHMLNYDSGFTAGQFPKFEDDVYWMEADEDTAEKNRHFMLPTAETALVNYYRDEIVDPSELPRKFFAYSPCYRKEAGSYRAEERGMIRGHQFNKVELFQYTTPEDSDQAFEALCSKACKLMSGLGLHFRLSKLAAGDCSASMARTHDIEVWIPSMNDYKEVSSASNAHDYQARRGNMRYRREDGKLGFMHTLNASGLATSRVFPAILEQYQQADGSIFIPEVLRPWMDGKDRIEAQIKA